MDDFVPALLTAVVSYLIGGIPFGYLIARARGVDIFKQGSGNIGATNVGRVLGRKFGILAFILDFAKGALPVVAVRALASRFATDLSGEELGVIAGLAAVLGHLFPAYLKFRGGKGVATAAGVTVILLPLPALAALLMWIGVVAATRYVSAGSLAAALTLCAARLLLTADAFARENLVLTVFCFVAAGLVFIRHGANIGRLLHGNENRLPEGGLMQSSSKVIHVLALGLWFGSVIFFSFVVGLSLFGAMDQLVLHHEEHPWFEVPPLYQKVYKDIDGRKEYGSRTAGQMISPMFAWYFLIQGVCGFLAVATAWRWQRTRPEKIHRLRVTVLLAALATVVLGWPLERHVHELGNVRHEKMETFFRGGSGEAGYEEAMAARVEFGRFHTYSLFLNFATIALVAAGMGMAAFLPGEEKRIAESTEQDRNISRQIAKTPS